MVWNNLYIYIYIYVYLSLFVLLNILFTTELRFANIIAKGPTFVVWWPGFKETYIRRSALGVKERCKKTSCLCSAWLCNADELK